MTSVKFDSAAQKAFTDCVKQIEKTSDAELVLVIQSRSGFYPHADFLFGALLSFLALIFLLFSPFYFHPVWVLVDVVLLFVLGAFLSSRINAIRRVFTSSRKRAEFVRTQAAAMFYEAGVGNTRAETGILVYVSLLERRLELLADRGLLKAVPSLEWNEQLFELHEAGRLADARLLLRALTNLSALLAKHLPASGDNPNELSDAPRFELK